MKNCTIQIYTTINGEDYIQEPVVLEGIQWETSRSGDPAKLTFTIIKDETISFPEGAEVNFMYGNQCVFSGIVLEKSRNKDQQIHVTCLDRTFYLKTVENYTFTGLRADQIIERVAKDVGHKVGELANTGYVLPKYAASDKTLLEVMQEVLDQTLLATGELYCLYDDFGYLTLKHIKDMQTDLLITNDTAEDFDYKTTINDSTFNYVVVKDGNGNMAVAKDDNSIKKYGLLQYVVDSQDGGNIQELANAILKSRNRVARAFSVNGAFGDINVRAGSGVYVYLYLGDHTCKQSMLVNHVTHTFNNGHHSMELTLIDGGSYYATK